MLKQVRLSARWARHHQKFSPSNDPEIDQIVLDKTELEVHTGMVAGTLPVEESDALDTCLPALSQAGRKRSAGPKSW